jgi:hypothetical protein
MNHVGILLPNGNVLLNCLGTVPAEIARQVKGGRKTIICPRRSTLLSPRRTLA